MHKILIVDDSVDHLEMLKLALESASFEVIAESDPNRVVKELSQNNLRFLRLEFSGLDCIIPFPVKFVLVYS